VQAGSSAVQLGTGIGNSVDVGSLGVLQGLSGFGFGIAGNGAATGDALSNLGTVSGAYAIGISDAGADTITNGGTILGVYGIDYVQNVAAEDVENSGTISGDIYAISSTGSSAGVNIINSGLITDSNLNTSSSVIILDDMAGELSTIQNKGTIFGSGTVISSSDQLDLTNSGTIHGNIDVSGAGSTLINSNTITGSISLGGENDQLSDDGGTVHGVVTPAATGDYVYVGGGGSISSIIDQASSVTINDYRGTVDGIALYQSDTVDYRGLFGESTINNFIAGSGSTHDILSFAANDFGSFTALSKDMTQVGSDTVIKRDSDDSITLVGVTKTSLVAADFAFTSEGRSGKPKRIAGSASLASEKPLARRQVAELRPVARTNARQAPPGAGRLCLEGVRAFPQGLGQRIGIIHDKLRGASRPCPSCKLRWRVGPSKLRAYRLLVLGLGRGRLAGAKHRPDLAAHVHQMKAASREFAEGHGVPGVNRHESMRLHVSDFMKVSEFEMLHRVLHRPHGIERVPPRPAQASSTLCCGAP
jgi:hypothetical protein